MIIFSLRNVSKYFGERALLDGINLDVQNKERIGLVGVNGAGKTTLFKLITGEMPRDGGDVYVAKDTKIGYMEQHVDNRLSSTLYEAALSVFAPLMQAERELEEIAARISAGEDPVRLVARQQRLHEQYEREGGYTYKQRTRSMLVGLGFTPEQLELPVSALSGGQRSKVALAKMLLQGAELLLLDEPTNHLDIQSIAWLEEYLLNFSGSYIVISHDRYFLDRVTNRTLEIRGGQLYSAAGNYSSYVRSRESEREIAWRHYTNTLKEIKRLEGIIEQQRRWNREKNIRTAESKQKAVDRLRETLQKPPESEGEIRLQFTPRAESSNDVLSCVDVSKSFGENALFHDVSLDIKKGDRVFLLGANGCGKTTLLKILLGEIAPDGGRVIWGQQVQRAYYDQTQASLGLSNTVLGEVQRQDPHSSDTQLRNALASFLFKGDDVYKRCDALSGGERARVQLLKLLLCRANFLLLDEPTNHLDIASCEAFERALENYEGTLLIVSHDRYLINRMADRVVYLCEEGITEFYGGYDDYVQAQAEQQAQRQAELQRQKREQREAKAQAGSIGRVSFAQQKQQRRAAAELRTVERSIETMEEEIAALEAELERSASEYEKLLQLTQRLEQQKQALDALYVRWEQLQQ